jgi:hypothetical protein
MAWAEALDAEKKAEAAHRTRRPRVLCHLGTGDTNAEDTARVLTWPTNPSPGFSAVQSETGDGSRVGPRKRRQPAGVRPRRAEGL